MPPGGARELKLQPFDSESKNTSGCTNSLISKKSPQTVCFHSTIMKIIENLHIKDRIKKRKAPSCSLEFLYPAADTDSKQLKFEVPKNFFNLICIENICLNMLTI